MRERKLTDPRGRIRCYSGVIALLAVGGASIVAPAPVQAAPIHNCGNLPDLFNGYQNVVNVTSRVVNCPKARNTARGIAWTMIRRGDDGPENGGPSSFGFYWTGWTVRGRWHATYYRGHFEGYWADVRATAARGWVVHFQIRGE